MSRTERRVWRAPGGTTDLRSARPFPLSASRPIRNPYTRTVLRAAPASTVGAELEAYGDRKLMAAAGLGTSAEITRGDASATTAKRRPAVFRAARLLRRFGSWSSK